MTTRILLAFVCAVGCSSLGATATAEELVYHGVWKATNRPIDGEMTCVVTPLGPEEWQGRFFGVWQGVSFDYTVDFTGPPMDLRGTATIDGAAYDWRGWIQRNRMKANYSGDRYQGSFDLKRKPART